MARHTVNQTHEHSKEAHEIVSSKDTIACCHFKRLSPGVTKRWSDRLQICAATLQAKPLVAGVPNLWMVESVDSIKLAGKLQAACAAAGRGAAGSERPPLKVLVQVRIILPLQQSCCCSRLKVTVRKHASLLERAQS